MRNVIVFQHVAHEPLGTLNPLLKAHGLRIRYVNFERDPNATPDLKGYNGLIILGGPMGVYEASRHPHLTLEMKIIEQAFKANIPVLGICLGAQLMAHVLGAKVSKNVEWEIGWCDFHVTASGVKDKLFSHFQPTERIFQLHGDAFEIPESAEHLAKSELCIGQAFRYGQKAYGLQCHLEADEPMIGRWLKRPENREHLQKAQGEGAIEKILSETKSQMARSHQLSDTAFHKFIELFELPERPLLLGSGHEKPRSNRKS